MNLRTAFAVLVLAAAPVLHAQNAAPERARVLRVCELLKQKKELSGKLTAVVGRFSFRQTGLYLSESACDGAASNAVMQVVYDLNSGPTLPSGFALDRPQLNTQLAAVKKTTKLANIRFGSPDYDRWALVIGRFEPAAETNGGKEEGEFASPSGRLVSRSETMVIMLLDSR